MQCGRGQVRVTRDRENGTMFQDLGCENGSVTGAPKALLPLLALFPPVLNEVGVVQVEALGKILDNLPSSPRDWPSRSSRDQTSNLSWTSVMVSSAEA
jgi:hypothetical protein